MKNLLFRLLGVALLLVLQYSTALAQDRVVTGTVVDDEKAEPLPGVSIVVPGTRVGTTTNAEGQFRLSLPNGSNTIRISSVGYKSIDRTVGSESTLSIRLVADENILNEVTVLAFGEQVKRRDIAGAVASVKAADIENLPTPSLEQMIQGRAAGVQVITNSGAPGGGITVRIRGTTSISADNQPLWVVDGVPLRNEAISGSLAVGSTNSPIADLNPADIESIEVLKDASTAALYGARAANGVVLVSTKRGKSGKAQIDFSAQYGVSYAPPKLKLLNATQAKALTAEYSFQTGDNSVGLFRLDPINSGRFQYGWYPEGIRSTDWQELIRQNGAFQNYNLSFRGGTQRSVLYALSLGHVNEAGTVKYTNFERTNMRANIDFFPVERLQVGTSFNVAFSDTRLTDRGSFFTDPIESSLRFWPDVQPYLVSTTDGTPSTTLYNDHPYDRVNPLTAITRGTNVQDQTRAYGNVYAQYQLIPNALTFRVSYGADFTSNDQRRFFPRSGKFFIARQAQQQNLQNFTWFSDYILNYFKTFGKHEVQGLLAFSQQYGTNKILAATGQDGANDAPESGYIGSAPRAISWNGVEIPGGLQSVTAKGTYTFDEIVSFSALVKRESSSRFPRSTRVGTFPAVAGFLRLNRLSFLQDVSNLSELKFRASWGITGNQNGIDDFRYLTTYASGFNYVQQPGITQAFLPNDQLKWETTVSSNFGLDLGVLDGRFYLTADYYVKNTRDLLLPVNLPTTAGFNSYVGNVGSTRNRGWELAFTGDVLRTRDFRWNINYNVSSNNNVLISSSSGDDLRAFYGDFLGVGRVGQPLGTWYGLQATNVLPNDSDAYLTQTGTNANGAPTYELTSTLPNAEPTLGANGQPLRMRSTIRGVREFTGGDLMYVDQNKDGVIDEADKVVVGRSQPKIYGGLNNTFTFKGFSLDVFLQYSLGNDVVNGTRWMLEQGGPFDNGLVSMARSWRTQGDVTDIPRIGERTVDGRGSGINTYGQTSRWVEDGSYLRLKNVALNYNLPKPLSAKLRMSNIRLYVSGQNLLTFTRYKGYDPEFNNSTNVLLLGFDFMNYPLPRRVVGGINITL
jgi:TonB-linked SusC/RagA family outer membrane protein